MSAGEFTYKLKRPIKAHDKEVDEITLREPTGDDVISIGYPYLVMMPDGDVAGIQIQPRVIYNYISKLGGIPLSSAKTIKFSDVAVLQAKIMDFFGEGEPGTLTSSQD